MDGLRRDPRAAAAGAYDLIVVGGGIQGAMLALDSARRGLRPLLVERDDFGGATSWNSHRIVHGGLRYLQRVDLQRFHESVAERRWFLRHFPDLVEPLPFLMPLYGRGARRVPIMRAALAANHLLSRRRNESVRSDRRIESGGVLTVPETISLFPAVERNRLRGGALWYDAVMKNSQRVLMETLRWASSQGARCVNYVQATGLVVEDGRVRGIEAIDGETGEPLELAGDLVFNCAGPWSRQLAASFDRDTNELFTASLAFNLLLDREPLSEAAVAATANTKGAHTYFLYPRYGRIYAGTAHLPWTGEIRKPRPTREQIDAVLDDINRAVPDLRLRRHQVLRVYAGLLPTTASGGSHLATHPVIHDHSKNGGPLGLFSISGVKYTTARAVAEKALRLALSALPATGDLPAIGEAAERPAPAELPGPDLLAGDDRVSDSAERLRELARGEAVVHLDDLVLRRLDWGEDPDTAPGIGPAVCAALGWDEPKASAEIERLRKLDEPR